MGLFDRLVGRKEPETRAGGGYTDAALDAAMDAATGSSQTVAEQTAAAEFGLGLLSRCFASALVEPAGVGPTLPAQLRADLARRLLVRGDAVYAIEVNRLGNIRLLPASFHDIAGGPDETTWRYFLEIPAPSRPESRRLPAEGVIHVRIGADPATPWKGCGPLENAGLSAALLARLEQRTSQEAGARVGYVLPLPEGTGDDSVAALKSDLKNLGGGIALVESTATGHGQGRNAAPQADWRLQRLGPEIPEANVTLRRQVGGDVLSAMGIPQALYAGADGATVREAYRLLLVGTLQPLAFLIGEELERKLELPKVGFNFRRLAAADIAARARAYGSLVSVGMDADRAELLTGLAE